MADHMAAEIWIGGKITSVQAVELAKTIVYQGVSLDWGTAPFQPQDAADLLEARSDLDGLPVLHLCDDQACGGHLESLEEFLKAKRIPFRRISDGKYEYDPEFAEYRPDLDWPLVRSWIANHSGEPVIPVSYLRPIGDLLKQLSLSGNLDRLLLLLGSAEAELTHLLPPQIPPLPAFEIDEVPDT
jgi:hypothetical protein